MVSKGWKRETVRFTYAAPNGIGKVALAGDFTGWVPQPMRRIKHGTFAVTVPLRPGVYEYKFLVDGRWVTDPDNGKWQLNPHGTFNSLAQVGG